MSFMKTLATLAVGFAAARGVDKYRKAGGMSGVQDTLRNADAPGGAADQLGAMAERMGIPGASDAIKGMAKQFGTATADATEAGQAGLGSLLAALSGAAASGAQSAEKMMGAMTGAEQVTEATEQNARLMIRAMIQAAKADGEIDADERARIMEHLTDASKEERAFVEAEMDAPLDVAGLAADTGDAMKAQVYATAVMAIKVDNAAESAYLDKLADALGIDAATRRQTHAAMGVA